MERYRIKGYESLEKGDNNQAIEYFLKAIEEGDALACIDMALEVKYIDTNYDYSKETLLAIHPSKFGIYLDKGIALGSLDCMFYKAREQVIGDELIPINIKEAKQTFLKLKELNYEPTYFNEEYTVDDYINLINDLSSRKY